MLPDPSTRAPHGQDRLLPELRQGHHRIRAHLLRQRHLRRGVPGKAVRGDLLPRRAAGSGRHLVLPALRQGQSPGRPTQGAAARLHQLRQTPRPGQRRASQEGWLPGDPAAVVLAHGRGLGRAAVAGLSRRRSPHHEPSETSSCRDTLKTSPSSSRQAVSDPPQTQALSRATMRSVRVRPWAAQ